MVKAVDWDTSKASNTQGWFTMKSNTNMLHYIEKSTGTNNIKELFTNTREREREMGGGGKRQDHACVKKMKCSNTKVNSNGKTEKQQKTID